jgi:hypothetical protein
VAVKKQLQYAGSSPNRAGSINSFQLSVVSYQTINLKDRKKFLVVRDQGSGNSIQSRCLISAVGLARTGKMKRFIVSIAVLAISVAVCEAGEIDGKWGLGVGIFGKSSGTLISLSRGVSNRTALLGSFSLRYEDGDSEFEENLIIEKSSQWSATVSIDGEWRRYIRSENTISPYIGLGPNAKFSKSKDSYTKDQIQWNTGVTFTLGAEYFVNEFFSLSTHLPFLKYSFDKYKRESSSDYVHRRSEHNVDFGINPSIVFRLYF